jgi:hypothetical protein
MEPFVYRDEAGEVVVRTVWWREGGFRVGDTDDAIRGCGSILLIQPQLAERLKRITGDVLRVSAWRASEEHSSKSKRNSARHREYSIQG